MDGSLNPALAGKVNCAVHAVTQIVSIHDVIRSHHDSLIKFLRSRLPIPEDANDVAQEAYIRMMKYEGAQDVRSQAAVLYRIAANVANDLGRAARARRAGHHLEIESMQLVSEQPSAERVVTGEQTLERLLDAIEELPPKCKRVFLLSRVQGMSYPEIASHCGVSVKMVEKHISRALAACLEKVGGFAFDTS